MQHSQMPYSQALHLKSYFQVFRQYFDGDIVNDDLFHPLVAMCIKLLHGDGFHKFIYFLSKLFFLRFFLQTSLKYFSNFFFVIFPTTLLLFIGYSWRNHPCVDNKRQTRLMPRHHSHKTRQSVLGHVPCTIGEL